MQPVEDLQSVTQRLSVFGPIESVRLCRWQSAVVVFKDTTSVCNAVNAFQSRAPGTMFQCFWQQRFMSKDVRHLLSKTHVNSSSFLHNLFSNSAPVKYNHHKRSFSTEERHSEAYLVQVLEIRKNCTSFPLTC